MVFIGSVLIIVIMSLWNSHAWEEKKKERKWEKEKGGGQGLMFGSWQTLSDISCSRTQRPPLQAVLLVALGDSGPVWIGSGGAACRMDLRWAEPGLALLGVFRNRALLSLGVAGPEELVVSFSLPFHSYSLPPPFLNFCSLKGLHFESLLLKWPVKQIFAGHKSWLHLIKSVALITIHIVLKQLHRKSLC